MLFFMTIILNLLIMANAGLDPKFVQHPDSRVDLHEKSIDRIETAVDELRREREELVDEIRKGRDELRKGQEELVYEFLKGVNEFRKGQEELMDLFRKEKKQSRTLLYIIIAIIVIKMIF